MLKPTNPFLRFIFAAPWGGLFEGAYEKFVKPEDGVSFWSAAVGSEGLFFALGAFLAVLFSELINEQSWTCHKWLQWRVRKGKVDRIPNWYVPDDDIDLIVYLNAIENPAGFSGKTYDIMGRLDIPANIHASTISLKVSHFFPNKSEAEVCFDLGSVARGAKTLRKIAELRVLDCCTDGDFRYVLENGNMSDWQNLKDARHIFSACVFANDRPQKCENSFNIGPSCKPEDWITRND